MSGYISLTNWDRFQHYSTRRPPWVKFYVELVRPDNRINQLPVPTRYLFDRLLLLAAEYENAIPNDHELIASVLRMENEDVAKGCEQLRKGRWIQVTKTRRRASKRASRNSSPETEAETYKPTPPKPPQELGELIDLTTARMGGLSS
jgi:hypothetical protein